MQHREAACQSGSRENAGNLLGGLRDSRRSAIIAEMSGDDAPQIETLGRA